MDAPRRLQTALGLYSSDLCGLVVLVDSPPPHYSGLAKRTARAAQQSTEFHFPNMDQQLDKIVEDIKLPVSYLKLFHCMIQKEPLPISSDYS